MNYVGTFQIIYYTNIFRLILKAQTLPKYDKFINERNKCKPSTIKYNNVCKQTITLQ